MPQKYKHLKYYGAKCTDTWYLTLSVKDFCYDNVLNIKILICVHTWPKKYRYNLPEILESQILQAVTWETKKPKMMVSSLTSIILFSGPKDCMFTIKHYFREGLITLTLEYFKINKEDALLYNYDEVQSQRTCIFFGLVLMVMLLSVVV